MQYKNHRFGVGWINETNNGGQVINAKVNGERDKVKLILELEDGSKVQPENFRVFFNDDKSSERAPDVNFVFSVQE